VGTLVIASVIFALAFANRNSVQGSASCAVKGKSHSVVIVNDTISPKRVDAKLCDTLAITNRDAKTREIGFGEHDQHKAYDGVSEKYLHKDESFTITLNETGEYHFHDHFQEEVEAEFTVVN
jgi:hypothetical protein